MVAMTVAEALASAGTLLLLAALFLNQIGVPGTDCAAYVCLDPTGAGRAWPATEEVPHAASANQAPGRNFPQIGTKLRLFRIYGMRRA